MNRFKTLALPTFVFVFVLLMLSAIEKGPISVAFEDEEERSCFDKRDNDDDGLIDCADPDCGNRCPESLCSDGVDNDFDGYVDCDDSDCFFFNRDCAGR